MEMHGANRANHC